jgi:hypothetical protein
LPNGTVLLCGGQNRSATTNPVDAWELRGFVWVPIAAGIGPDSRVAVAMTYDSSDGYPILFGGRYFAAGTAHKSLNDSWAFDTLTAQIVPPPTNATAPFTFSPSANVVGGPLNFDGSSSVAYVWSFGDGSTSMATAPTHTYVKPGNQTLGLALRDGFGLTLSLTTTLVVEFAVNVTILPLSNPKETYQFSAFAANATAPLSWAWEFGDGSTSTVAAPVHTYNATGPVTVHVEARDANGAIGAANRLFTVTVATAPHSVSRPGGAVLSWLSNPEFAAVAIAVAVAAALAAALALRRMRRPPVPEPVTEPPEPSAP